MSFNDGGDLCLGFWRQAWDDGKVPLPHGARVLEVGCAEADWLTPMKAERPDLHLTGIDWRKCERQGADVLVQADVLTHEFPLHTFDAVVAVSAIEHIGLGHYDADPKDDDGDVQTARRVATWLKKGGLFYFDVPYRPNGPYAVHGGYRAYDPEALAKRLTAPFQVQHYAVIENSHPDGPYILVVCHA